MHALRKLAAGELVKSPRKSRLRRHLARMRKPAQPAQGGLAAQRVDEGGSCGKLIHALGRKRMHEPEAFTRWPAMAQPGKLGLEAFELRERNDLHELPVQNAQWTRLLFQCREQTALEKHGKIAQLMHPLFDPLPIAAFTSF